MSAGDVTGDKGRLHQLKHPGRKLTLILLALTTFTLVNSTGLGCNALRVAARTGA
jgi:hypothetical protein